MTARPGVVSSLKAALGSDHTRRTLWFSAAFSVLAFSLAFAICLALGRRDLALAAGLVAMFAVAGSGVVPPGLTRQVGIPAAVAVLITPVLVLISDRQPIVAATVMAIVMVVASISSADVPTGSVVGLMGSLSLTLGMASRSLHDVPWTDALLVSGLAGLVAAAGIAGLAGWRALGIKEHSRLAIPAVPHLPGSEWQRYRLAVDPVIRRWRTNPYARLALRRTVVMAPLTAVLVAWGDPSGLFALLAAFAALQPTATASTRRAIAQIAGSVVACTLAVILGFVVSGLLLLAIGILGMAIGLAFVLRSPFIAAAGTTAFALAGAGMAGGMADIAQGRFLSTLAGAAIAIIATVVIRPAPNQDSPSDG